MHIGVIPARAGSKRFPGKNRAKFNGTSLWAIATEKSLKMCDLTIVNTDDPQIPDDSGEVLYEGSIKVYRRPKHLTDGISYRIDDVIIEMVENLGLEDEDIIHLFQPTSPFLSEETVDKGKKLFQHLNYIDSVQSIYKVNNTFHAYSQRKVNNGFIDFAFPELRNEHYNSQKKPEHFVFAGYVACRVGSLRKNKSLWGASIGIPVDELETVDIDTREDLDAAIRLARTNL